jgi:hypothetical protein
LKKKKEKEGNHHRDTDSPSLNSRDGVRDESLTQLISSNMFIIETLGDFLQVAKLRKGGPQIC